MSEGHGQGARTRIDDLILDQRRRQVRRGEAVLKLPKLSYRMFLVLVEAAPSVLTHDELVARVWGGRVVSPETVTQRIKLLRSALGDDASHPRYIALVRGEGYRLVPDVAYLPGDEGAGSGQFSRANNWAATVAVSFVVAVIAAGGLYFLLDVSQTSPGTGTQTIVPPVRPNSIAVLPFDNVNLEPKDEYIADGIASTLIDQLTYVDDLSVKARSSSSTFRSGEDDATAIASRLGVERLVEGALERTGDRFTITVSIVEGDSGFRVWSDRFEGPRADLPMLQRDIARRIIAALVPEYAGEAASRGSASLDPTAYDLMLLARARYEDVRDQPIVDEQKLDEAIALFRSLTELEPDSPQAYSRLAAALLYKGDVAAAAGPIDRAISIDPESAEAHYTRGLYKWLLYEDGSGEAYERAIALNPNHADAQEAYAKYVWHQLVSDGPERHFLRALEFDPQRLTRYTDLGIYYGHSGRVGKARSTARLIADRFDSVAAFLAIARILELTGDLDEAIGWALFAHESATDREETAWALAELYARIGDFETARLYESEPAFNLLYWERRYDEMIELGEDLIFEYPQQSQIWYGMARAFTGTGQYARTIEYLRRQKIPERAYSEARRANDEEALVMLADALKMVGDTDQAKQIAARFRPFLVTMLSTGGEKAWWPNLYIACVDSILDDDAAALGSLERVPDTEGIPWQPLVLDTPCFRKFEEHPAYRNLVGSIEVRKAELRARLPETLASFRRDRAAGKAPAASIRTSDSMRR